MLKKILSGIFLIAVFMAVLFLAHPGISLADTSYGLNDTAREVNAFKEQIGSDALSGSFIQTRTGQIIGFVLSFVGVLFLVLMIYAGLTWMIAGGNDQKIDKAKSLLTNAVIGLIIVFAAYAITAFVGEFVSNEMLK